MENLVGPFDLKGFLDEPRRMAQVATVSPHGLPLLGSVWFQFAAGRFWFTSHPSTPFGRAAERGATVAVLVDQFDPPQAIRQLRIRGTSRIEQHDPHRVHAIFQRYLGTEPESWPPFFQARQHDTEWALWSVRPDTGVATTNPHFRPTEYRWSRRQDAPAPLD